MDITSQVYMVYVLMILYVLLNDEYELADHPCPKVRSTNVRVCVGKWTPFSKSLDPPLDAQSIIIETPGSLGSTVTLPCQDTGGSVVVVWTYIFANGTELVYAGNQYIVEGTLLGDLKGRLRITGNYAAREYNLEISNLKHSDEGNYKCTSSLKELTRVHLYIPEPPTAVSVPTLTDQNRILGTEDQDLTITCAAIGGKPPPEVTLKEKNDNYIYKTDIQSLLYTFSMIKRDFDLKTLLCVANSSALSSPLKQEVQIYLDLKPFPPDMSPEPEASENTRPLYVVCTSRGSRPAGSIYWKIGQISITAHSTQNTTHNLSTDTYTMTSELTYSVNRSHNGQRLTCGAVNKILNSGRETSKTVNVTFAPDVSVSNVTYNQNDSNRTVTCTAFGNPPVYVYSWLHMSTYGVVVREWTNLQNAVLTLPNITFNDRYQDSGEYNCTVSNGVSDAQGNIIHHTGAGYVKIHALPVFTLNNNQTQYGELSKSTAIHVHVYSVPMYTKTTWYKDNITTSNPSKYVQLVNHAIVHDNFHTKPVALDGYRVTLIINDLTEDDFTNYMVQLTNMVGTVMYSMNLYPTGPPQTPINFSVTGSSSTTINVQWVPGFNGGYQQTFYIEYRIQNSVDWISSIPIEDDKKGLLHQMQSYTLQGLQPGTVYELRMYASNVKNQSRPTTSKIKATISKDSLVAVDSVIGGVLGGLSLTVIIIIALVIFTKHRGPNSYLCHRGTFANCSEQCKKNTKDKVRKYDNVGMTSSDSNYEEIEKKGKSKHMQDSETDSKAYEALRLKYKSNIDDDQKAKGMSHFEETGREYVSLGLKDKTNVYEQIDKGQGKKNKIYENERF